MIYIYFIIYNIFFIAKYCHEHELLLSINANLANCVGLLPFFHGSQEKYVCQLLFCTQVVVVSFTFGELGTVSVKVKPM